MIEAVRALAFLVLVGCLGLGCESEETAAPFAPRGRGEGDAGPGSDASAGDAKPTGAGNVTNAGGAGASDPGKDAPDGTIQHGGMLAVLELDDDLCVLHAVWGGKGQIGDAFPCDAESHVFRRSDGAHFYALDGKIWQNETGEDSEVSTKCTRPIVEFGFDGSGSLYYHCLSGRDSFLYRDDEWIDDNLAGTLLGVMDDGQMLIGTFDEYYVIDRDGKHVSTRESEEEFRTAFDAATVAAKAGHVLLLDNSGGMRARYVTMSYEDGEWTPLSSFEGSGAFGSSTGAEMRVTPEGAVFTIGVDEVWRYAPNGARSVVWSGKSGTLLPYYALVYYP